MNFQIISIGSVMWDIIGKSAIVTERGDDVPGIISREPGGVAFNIAHNLVSHGRRPILLSAIGRDPEGSDLISTCLNLGFDMDHIYRPSDLPTDHYIGIEDPNGLVLAIAQTSTVEICSNKLIRPLLNGTLGSMTAPFKGTIIIDTNLATKTLADIANSPEFSECDIKLAAASPYKAKRLLPFLGRPNCTIYCNLNEAETICQSTFTTSREAVEHLLQRGAARAVVTNGTKAVSEGGQLSGIITALPSAVSVKRVTGAGDVFMASHLNAELMGCSREQALDRALLAAKQHITSEAKKL